MSTARRRLPRKALAIQAVPPDSPLLEIAGDWQLFLAIKLIFISGYTANIMHEKGIFEKDMDFITKPFLKDDLLRKVREVLDKG